MKINLEILDYGHISATTQADELTTKALVPKMVFRRRLTRAAKLVVELMNKVDFKEGRVIYGSAFGELPATANILTSILNEEMLSPTDFQNSVYNTAVSYASILHKNRHEVLTLSSGENTADRLLKVGAVKALDGDTLLLVATETLNIENIHEVNSCIDYLETAVALKVKVTDAKATVNISDISSSEFPLSIASLITLSQSLDKNQKNIIEVEL